MQDATNRPRKVAVTGCVLPGVFVGRFFGPLRAIVPLVAGACGMPQVPFQVANVTSAAAWATLILAPGPALLAWLG